MRVLFKTFSVGCGDCCILRLEDSNDTFNIMVDCGCYTDGVKKYVQETFENHIHLLVVTHIDNDHILGLKMMLSEEKSLVIDKIIYNCCQSTPLENRRKLSSKTDELIKKKKQQILPHSPILGKTEIGAMDALTLAEIMLKNTFRNAWVSNRSYTTIDSQDLMIKNGQLGKLIFLSPCNEDLDKLDKKFREKFYEKFYTPLTQDVVNQETLFEMLGKLVDEDETEIITKEYIATNTKLSLEMLQKLAHDEHSTISPTNMASIAFLWIKDEHSILFMGDASPKIVRESIQNKNIFQDKPHIVDAIKVSHHGSKHSVDNELADIIDSENYFFTGGCNNEMTQRPSLESISKIITHTKPKGLAQRHLNFNFISDDVQKLRDSSQELSASLGFDILTDKNEYEITL